MHVLSTESILGIFSPKSGPTTRSKFRTKIAVLRKFSDRSLGDGPLCVTWAQVDDIL